MTFSCDPAPLPGDFLMERDATRWKEQECEPGRPASLRLFRWDRPTLSFGHAQDPDLEFDLTALRDAAIPWVRRPTGGRAILHDQEWTFSVVGGIGDPRLGGTLRETYAIISAMVRETLSQLGVTVDAATVGPPRAGDGRLRAACFASAWGFEITVGGRKLVGSAQRRGRAAFLQQGTLLVRAGHERVVEWMRLPPAAREEVRSLLTNATTSLAQECGKPPAFDEFAEALEASWSSTPSTKHSALA